MMENLKNIIESLLFVADGPLTLQRLTNIIEEAETKDIKAALQALKDDYETRLGGLFLHEVAGGYQFRTRPDYNTWVKRLLQPPPMRLSKPALETLAIVAYHQPVIRADVERIRGVDSGGTLRTLLERKFIRILGRKDIPGRPLIYATTQQFLEVFDLKNLKDLPTPKEIEAYMDAGVLDGYEPPEDVAASDPAKTDEVPEGRQDQDDQATTNGSAGNEQADMAGEPQETSPADMATEADQIPAAKEDAPDEKIT